MSIKQINYNRPKTGGKEPNMAKTTNKKEQQAQQVESGKYYLSGVVTTAMYGKRSFTNGKSDKENRYRISLKCTKDAIEGLKEAAEPFYVDQEERWIPDWIKNDVDEDGGYINMSSGFDIRCGEYKDGVIKDLGSMTDFIADQGGNINGSKVVVLVGIKLGAIYPNAMIIKELHTQDIGSMFDTDDAGFTAAFDEDLPF